MERGSIAQLKARPKPFSQVFMHALIPANYITSKIVFTGVEHPESHLTTFNAQMIISGGTDAIHCKMFMGTLTDTTLQWFSGLPDGHITSFDQFSKLFSDTNPKMTKETTRKCSYQSLKTLHTKKFLKTTFSPLPLSHQPKPPIWNVLNV